MEKFKKRFPDILSVHGTDLKKSGLNDRTIRDSGIRSISTHELEDIGVSDENVTSAYEIPYGDGFCRYKLFYHEGKTGKKYHQRYGSANRLYIPERVKPRLDDNSVPLFITEGEKKTMKAVQEGLICVGLSGLWCWSAGEKRLVPDFDKILLQGREVFIVPDNDWKQPDKNGYKKNLANAVNELAERLTQRGAVVRIIELPAGPAKGLDDYLKENIVDDLMRLPRRAAAVSKTKPSSKKEDVELRAVFPGLVDLATDRNGQIVYLMKTGRRLSWEYEKNVGGINYRPPSQQSLPFEIPRADEIIRHYEGGDEDLYKNLNEYLEKFSYLEDSQRLVITLYVFLTYLQDHADIHYIPYLLFYAVPERGKSKTGKAIISVSYRGLHLPNIREPSLFRFSNDLNATLFLDAMDLWRSIDCKDLLLQRFEKGAKVPRVLHPEKGAFADTSYFNAFGPTILATNQDIHNILETRCIPIVIPNKPGSYRDSAGEDSLIFRERLLAWRASMMNRSLPDVEQPKGIQGRLWDVSKPLFQICKLVCDDQYERLEKFLVSIARQKSEEKRNSDEGVIIGIIRDLSPESVPKWSLQTSSVLERMNQLLPPDRQVTSQWLGRRLKAMGVSTSRASGNSRIFLDSKSFRILCQQYGHDE